MKRKLREPSPPIATFGDLLRCGEKWAWLHCNNRQCLRTVALPFAPFAIRWGLGAAATAVIRKYFRCSNCGDMTATLTMPSWGVGTETVQIFPIERGLRVVPAHAWLDAMCNLYSMTHPRDEARKFFRVSDNRAVQYELFPSIFPGYAAPVVRLANDGERELVTLSWGFVLLLDGKAPRRVTNVRDDKIQDSGFWKGSFEERRCLVPASSFCEPKGEKPATWYWFALNGNEPRPLFAFAGIWRKYKGPIKKDGTNVELDVFAFATTTPNKLVATINHERMPAILATEEEFAQWLTGKPDDAYSLIRPYRPEKMRIVQQGNEKLDKLDEEGSIGSTVPSEIPK